MGYKQRKNIEFVEGGIPYRHKNSAACAGCKYLETGEEQRWIPVAERLPNNKQDDWVLAQITENNGYMWIPKVVEYREVKNDWYYEELGWLKDHKGLFAVTHWMPLPKAPKKGGTA